MKNLILILFTGIMFSCSNERYQLQSYSYDGRKEIFVIDSRNVYIYKGSEGWKDIGSPANGKVFEGTEKTKKK